MGEALGLAARVLDPSCCAATDITRLGSSPEDKDNDTCFAAVLRPTDVLGLT